MPHIAVSPRGHICLPRAAVAQGATLSLAAIQEALPPGAGPTVSHNARSACFEVPPTAHVGSRRISVHCGLSEPVTLHVFLEQPLAQATAAAATEDNATTTPSERAAAERRDVLREKRIFVVGAGGIGCELLKNLVLAGASRIVAVDLDTIDSTNLNRQFLFAQQHVGRSKAVVAAEVVTSWREGRGVDVNGVEGNVKDAAYDSTFYEGFDIVINGLDNVSARKHVNRMCVQAGLPLVESGTMGYNGQVQPIVKGVVECYDCRPKPTEQKTFAVCTIHARPTTIVHCVHYAKEVYGRLFGDSITGADAASSSADSAQPVSELDYLAADLFETRNENGQQQQRHSTSDIVVRLYDTLFVEKVKELLVLKSDWTIRPPVPLQPSSTIATYGAMVDPLADVLEPSELYALLSASIAALSSRGRRAFTKDDDDAVAFVAAVANLRALNFHIKTESVHKVKTIAGNIVPAIASTNAVVAACAVQSAVNLLCGRSQHIEYVTLRHAAQIRKRTVTATKVNTSNEGDVKRQVVVKVKDQYLLHGFPADAPNPACLVCSPNQRRATVECNAAVQTLGSFVRNFLMREMCLTCPTVDAGSNTLYEHEEFEDLGAKPLTTWLPATRGATAVFAVGDLHQSVEWTLTLQHNFKLDETVFITTAGDFKVAVNTKAAETTTDASVDDDQVLSSQPQYSAAEGDDDDVVAFHPAAKRNRAEGGHAVAHAAAAVDLIED
jgi:ubiquitin-like 1-activating enzyme E1 B